ncbi:MAG TPA: MXAN_5187 C-terminal domain-containing protein [Myxococcota bacterium]|nr:MXAN_5187 C-terminal domain-containing protein [Myxococcota bacterium]HRY97044.1 MXAN_5187 C-terminal domain-containing protein [Myxococcota bacterium]HSA24301.1 MXAN_5187 C-terminal domain-containing protein [Myxococcota bacterium]
MAVPGKNGKATTPPKPGTAAAQAAKDGKDQGSQELSQEAEILDGEMDRLRTIYEQYFQGIERLEPFHLRDNIKRRLNVLHTTNIRNTALRFRVQQLVAKFATYQNYWSRICKQIEEGTYARDLFKARLHSKERERKERDKRGEGQDSLDAQDAPAADGLDQEVTEPKARPTPAAAARPGGGLSEDQVHAIYSAFVTAKRRCKEDPGALSAETLGASLRRQIPTIMKTYKCKSVEFKVVIKGGKALLKAVPKY